MVSPRQDGAHAVHGVKQCGAAVLQCSATVSQCGATVSHVYTGHAPATRARRTQVRAHSACRKWAPRPFSGTKAGISGVKIGKAGERLNCFQ